VFGRAEIVARNYKFTTPWEQVHGVDFELERAD